MSYELDHFLICTAPGAPEGQLLVDFGLIEGAPNRHPGQGTANRRFFFANAFLELVWVEDESEVQSESVKRTGLWERWSLRSGGASPFGVCLRPGDAATTRPPFAAWEYRPPYLPDPLLIHMAENSHVAGEPLLLYLAFGRRADSGDPARRQPPDHARGLREITRLCLHGPITQPKDEALQAVESQCASTSFVPDRQHWAEVGFDGERQGHSHDFRPALPLVLRW